MTEELFCYDCNRAANTECVEQKHRTSFVDPEEVEGMGVEQRRCVELVEALKTSIAIIKELHERNMELINEAKALAEKEI